MLFDIPNNIINYNFDYCEYLSYVANICKKIHKKRVLYYYAQCKDWKKSMYNFYVYSNIDNKKQNWML